MLNHINSTFIIILIRKWSKRSRAFVNFKISWKKQPWQIHIQQKSRLCSASVSGGTSSALCLLWWWCAEQPYTIRQVSQCKLFTVGTSMRTLSNPLKPFVAYTFTKTWMKMTCIIAVSGKMSWRSGHEHWLVSRLVISKYQFNLPISLFIQHLISIPR